MSKKKAYVSPQVIRVKLEPSQAVLSQCSVGVSPLRNTNPAGSCDSDPTKLCKQASHGGDPTATS
ncbi:MAG: hypothetical protein V3T60_13330 [Candidatus Binatia bacterium]